MITLLSVSKDLLITRKSNVINKVQAHWHVQVLLWVAASHNAYLPNLDALQKDVQTNSKLSAKVKLCSITASSNRSPRGICNVDVITEAQLQRRSISPYMLTHVKAK
jgi:hypothetical protein